MYKCIGIIFIRALYIPKLYQQLNAQTAVSSESYRFTRKQAGALSSHDCTWYADASLAAHCVT